MHNIFYVTISIYKRKQKVYFFQMYKLYSHLHMKLLIEILFYQIKVTNIINIKYFLKKL